MNETEEMLAGDGHAAPDEHAAHNVAKHVRKYLLVGATLITFTAITVFLSYVNFGTMKANVAVAMAVVLSATLIAGWLEIRRIECCWPAEREARIARDSAALGAALHAAVSEARRLA